MTRRCLSLFLRMLSVVAFALNKYRNISTIVPAHSNVPEVMDKDTNTNTNVPS